MTLYAGAARRDISPIKPVQLCGYPHVRRISSGSHDPLLASALYLRSGGDAVLLGALDLLMLNCDVARRIRCRVAGELGFAEANVLISCTHTHSGPVTLDYLPFHGDSAMPPPDPAYLRFCEEQIVQTARDAKANARKAELAWTNADACGIGGNRHSPTGPTDPDVGILAVRAAGKLLAVAIIYGMHPTVLHEDSTLISADFPYYTRRHLQEALGDQLVVLYHTGPAGDQSPRYHVQSQTFAEAERLGRQLGAAVLPRLENMVFQGGVRLAGALQPVDFPRRQFPGVMEAEKVLARYRAEHERLQTTGAAPAEVRTAEVAVFGAEALLRLARAQESGEIDQRLGRYRPFEIQVLRIGEVHLAAWPGEFFVEYGLQLKQRAPVKTLVVTYANGELQGYIVTPEAVARGGYEADGRMFEPAAGQRVVDTTLALLTR